MILSIKQTKSCNIDFKTLFASKANGDIVTVGNLMIQAGWTQFLGNNRNTIEVPIAFPKQFKKIFSITASFNGYKNGESW